MSSYLSASPVVCADGDYPFSSIHVTPRISSSITRSARVDWTARHKFASFPKCGRTRPPRPPPSWNEVELCSALLRSLGVALLVGGLAGSPRRKAVDAQSPHSRERPRCVSESECGTSRGAPRSPGRLVHRRHEADAKTRRHGSVCLLVS